MKCWEAKPLGELVTIEKGKKAPVTFAAPTRTSVRYMQIEDLRPNATLKYCEPFNCPSATSSDAIIAWDGANAGTVSCNLTGHIGSTLALLRPIAPDKLCSAFLSRFLQSNFDHLQRTASGSTIPHVSKDVFNSLRIPLPPLQEQQRIVKLLDEVDELRSLRSHAHDRAVELIPALFQEMFGNPTTNPFAWPVETLGTMFDPVRGGARCGPFGSALKKREYVDSGVPVWGIPNVLPNQFVESGSLFVSRLKFEELEAYAIESGDLLLSRAGTVGRICVARPIARDSIIGSNLIRLALDQKRVVPEFFSTLLTHFAKAVGRLRTSADEGTYSFMNTTVLKTLRVYVPPLPPQQEFAHRLKKIRELESAQAQSRNRLDALFGSLLDKAFRGEL